MHIAKTLAAASAAFFVSGCTGAQLVSNAQEAGAAAKSYVDERTDRREDLRLREYQIQDAILSAYMRKAQQAEADGNLDKAVELYGQALEVIDRYYPDLASLSDEIRNTVSAIRGEPVDGGE